MFDSFIGRHENKIDGKSRMSIPAEFRKALEAGDPDFDTSSPARLLLVIGDGQRPYVMGCTMTWLAKIKQQLTQFGPNDPRREAIEDMLFEQSVLVSLDPTGRIVVPTRVREALGLTGEAVIVGRNETFRIWEPSTYAGHKRTRPADPSIGFDPNRDPLDYIGGAAMPEL